MVFSSTIFLYVFLPVALLLNFAAPRQWRNAILLVLSLLFYAWGGVSYSLLMAGSILINYVTGLSIEKARSNGKEKRALTIGVILNLALLCYFKYLAFFIENINSVFSEPLWKVPSIVLPIGISFYTFHGISYIVDVYRQKSEAQKSLTNLSLYITFFPQLVAGPIIRYHDIWQQLTHRKIDIEKFASGIERFIIGLAKKVLLANTFAIAADDIFGYNAEMLSTHAAWLGIISYTLQIYFDFSGYSDMAIGLARMFGFDFKENFNLPYIARSIQDYWRRWHISLSTWFRDYLYIPLGGNRAGEARTYLNLFIVFLCTGFWHGASWNFIVWGLLHGLFIILERLGLNRFLEKMPGIVSHAYTLLIVVFAWVFFRADDLGHALSYASAMLGFGADVPLGNTLYLLNDAWLYSFIFGVLGAAGCFYLLGDWLGKAQSLSLAQGKLAVTVTGTLYAAGKLAVLALLLFGCLMSLAAESYSPFIYFRF
jgi:alginate O-acetyltransferase complex protein AlgI